MFGLKFDARFPFFNFFYLKQSFPSNHSFSQVILLKASIQWKYYSGVQIAQIFDPVLLHTIRHWAFPIFLLPIFLNFNMFIIYCKLFQFMFHLLQPVCVLSVRHDMVLSLQQSLLSSASGITLSLCVSSSQFVANLPATLISFNLIVLIICVMLSASLKPFFAH